jgi:hypothetical protein
MPGSEAAQEGLLPDDAADAAFLDTVVPVTDSSIIEDALNGGWHGVGNASVSVSGS